MTEIETLDALRARLPANLSGCVVQGLDLRGLPELRGESGEGITFLGCKLDPEVQAHLFETGAALFPELPGLPYKPYRPSLYTPADLMEGFVRGDAESFVRDTVDARIYEHYQASRSVAHPSILEELAQRLHDHAIDDALHALLRGELSEDGEEKKVVAIMGGHAMKRSEDAFRTVAEIARELTRRGYFLVSGGGPGAMEATQLGAYLSKFEDQALDFALDTMKVADSYKDPAWFDTAYTVLDRYADGAESLGIPTWFYGHEPSNLFATHVAKYFSNSLREDGLLAIATYGVIYAPGSAGTIQEVFMDLAQNHYGTFKMVSPMVFLGRDYWTREKPVFPLVKSLAKGRQYETSLGICDTADEIVVHILKNYPMVFS